MYHNFNWNKEFWTLNESFKRTEKETQRTNNKPALE